MGVLGAYFRVVGGSSVVGGFVSSPPFQFVCVGEVRDPGVPVLGMAHDFLGLGCIWDPPRGWGPLSFCPGSAFQLLVPEG